MGSANSGLPDVPGSGCKRSVSVRESDLPTGLRRNVCLRASRQQSTWHTIEDRREQAEVDDTEIDGVNF